MTVISVIENLQYNSNENLHGLKAFEKQLSTTEFFQITGAYMYGISRGRKLVIAAITIKTSEAKPERETVIGLLRI